jgi:hypothetical protein
MQNAPGANDRTLVQEPTMKKRSRSKPVAPEALGDLVVGAGLLHSRAKPHPLFALPPAIVETVFFSRVGHTFKKIPQVGGPTLYAVQDFLLDQTGTSGADGAMSASKAFDLTTAVSYRVNVLPKDRTKRIKVVPPATGPAFFGMNVGRRFISAVSDYYDQYVSSSFFVNLLGLTPVLSYNSFFIGHNTNHWIQFTVMADIAAPIEFSGFTTYGVYPPRSFDPGAKSYIPFSTSVPFNLPSPNGVPHLMFAYATTDPVDPGPFVSMA